MSLCFLALRALHGLEPSRLTRLRALCLFVPYAPLRLTCFTHAPCASLRSLYALFVHFKIALGQIVSPPKTYHFPRIIKGTTNCAVFKWVKKEPLKFLSWKNFMLLLQ